MPGKGARVFSPEFKEAAVLRILAGERVQALAAELHVWPKLLYDWWSKYDRSGAAALRRAGRPPRSAGEVIEPTAPLPPRAGRHRRRGRPRADRDDEAGKRIAELERTVGEQALELIFSEGPYGTSRRHPGRATGVADPHLRAGAAETSETVTNFVVSL
jgi:transposase